MKVKNKPWHSLNYTPLFGFGCSLFSRSQQTNRSASPVKRYRRWEPWQMFQIVAVWNICAFLCLWLRFIPFLLTFIHPRLHWVLLKAWETALWCHRAAREIGRTFMWGFGHHTPWRMAYMRGGLFFQGRLASVFGEDGLPSHLHLFWKPGYPSLQATWTCHSPHKCAILYAPISIAEVSESYFSVSTFSYFFICLYKYIVL